MFSWDDLEEMTREELYSQEWTITPYPDVVMIHEVTGELKRVPRIPENCFIDKDDPLYRKRKMGK